MQVVDCILNRKACCLTWFGAHIPLMTSLGSVEFDSSGKIITKVRIFVNTFYIIFLHNGTRTREDKQSVQS